MSDMMGNEDFIHNSESEYEQEEVSTEDTESVESSVEEEDIDEIIYNDLLHLAILVKNIPKDELSERMDTIKGIAKGEIVLIENDDKPNNNNETQLFALVMTLLVIIMGVIIGALIETKMDLFNLQKFT